MLYVFDEFDSLDSNFLMCCDTLLSQERKDKVQRLKSKQGKIQSAAAYLLLRYALCEEFGIDEAVNFEYNEYGKPLLQGYAHIHFNLSHCKSAVACVLSDSEVGVDVQEIRPVSDKLKKRVLTNEEWEMYCNIALQPEYFTKIWTIKEAYAKKSGQGISSDFSKINSNDITDITVFQNKDYYCSVTKKDCSIKKGFLYER